MDGCGETIAPTPRMYSLKVFPVINKSTVDSAGVCAAASHPDGFYSLTSDIRREQKGGESSALWEPCGPSAWSRARLAQWSVHTVHWLLSQCFT